MPVSCIEFVNPTPLAFFLFLVNPSPPPLSQYFSPVLRFLLFNIHITHIIVTSKPQLVQKHGRGGARRRARSPACETHVIFERRASAIEVVPDLRSIHAGVNVA